MKCRVKYLFYLLFSLGFASSLVLMVYKVTQQDMYVLLGNNTFISQFHWIATTVRPNDSIPATVRPNDSIPMMNFKDLGNDKEQLLLLVFVNSAPHKFERRQAIRSTWWRHCTHSQVNKIFIL